MFKPIKINERILYEVWKSDGFKSQLKTIDDQKIEIIDAGENNKDFAGPDFFNSRIKIGDLTFLGDVEIDISHSDWKSHGHYLDKKYNKVILHVVINRERFQPFVYTQDGRKVISICITDFLEEDYQQSIQKAIQSERANRSFIMPCSQINEKVSPEDKYKVVSILGIERFKKKEERILHRLKEIIYLKQMNVREPVVRYDFGEDFWNKKFAAEEFNDPVLWNQLLYEMIFEALGYSKNKDNMIKLAKAVNINFLQKYSSSPHFEEIVECALFNVSGIINANMKGINEETAEYLRHLIEKWSGIVGQYDGPVFNKERWNFFKLRPQNFPTVRIAGGSRIIKKIIKDDMVGKLISLFIDNENSRKITSVLRNSIIVRASGFWRNHFVFTKNAKVSLNYFIGLSRADEMIVNVVLPVLAVYFEVFGNKQAEHRVKNFYLNFYQKSSNKVIDQVEESLHLDISKCTSVHTQGMIELFRNYCVKEKCLECKIGKVVFN